MVDPVFIVFEGGEIYTEESSSEVSLAQLRINSNESNDIYKILLIIYRF